MASRNIKCSCGGDLDIVGDVMEDKIRVALRLKCAICGKNWRYGKGHFFEEKN